MQVTAWLQTLQPYLKDLSNERRLALEPECHGRFHGAHCPECQNAHWIVSKVQEPKFQKTNWKIEARCSSCAHEVTLYNANELGWDYPQDGATSLACDCGGLNFRLILVFEPYEDAETNDDISWFWLWSECAGCGHQEMLVDWELD